MTANNCYTAAPEPRGDDAESEFRTNHAGLSDRFRSLEPMYYVIMSLLLVGAIVVFVMLKKKGQG